jgi:hypothetical protein
MKEALKHLKIWDKNTATTRAPLRKVRDADITAAESDEVMNNYFGKNRTYIDAAIHISRSRV